MMALFIPSKRILPLTLLFLLLAVSYHQAFADTGAAADGSTLCEEEGTCQWEDSTIGGGQQEALKDPNLVPLTVEFDDYRTTQDVYVMPDIATFYNATPGSKRKLETSFKGQFAKFINMSPDRVKIFWKGQKENVYIADISPFGAAGTASYPGHRFLVTDNNDASKVFKEFYISPTNSLYSYDPIGSLKAAQEQLVPEQYDLYRLQHRNLAFNKIYQQKTGRQWLALFGRKHKPRFPMWSADSFGQTHTVVTNQTYFVQQPPNRLAMTQMSGGAPSDRDWRLLEQLQPYRSKESTLTLNLTVLSVAPRVFEIQNFLSNEEVTHMLELATGAKLARSTTRAGGDIAEITTSDATRTSKNSWIARHRTAIVDAIYRRAADLLRIDEACFRYRNEDTEKDIVPNSTVPVTERLQLVHYDVGQQYTPHHDFAVPDLREGQPSRFATLLLYLNEGMEGGETSFPRWLNTETKDILKAKPQVGKAILFYNVLPDGNYDERSQHAALPVTKGEKWLTNLWIWDPTMA